MTVTEKITKLQELTKEINSIKKNFNIDMFNFVIEEFKKRGFVTDPRGKDFERGLYNSELKVSVRIGNIGTSYISISVIDMVNDGMNWGSAYNKIPGGTQIRFNFKTKTFETFFNTTFTNRVNKLNRLLEN